MIIFGAFQSFPRQLCFGRKILSVIDELEPKIELIRLVDLKQGKWGSTLQDAQAAYETKLKDKYPNAIFSDIEVETDNPMIVNAIKECKTVEEIEKILLLM